MANMKTNLNFEEVSHYGYKSFKCPGCGHWKERSKKFHKMIAPGSERLEVTQELIKQAKTWQDTVHLCGKCEWELKEEAKWKAIRSDKSSKVMQE